MTVPAKAGKAVQAQRSSIQSVGCSLTTSGSSIVAATRLEKMAVSITLSSLLNPFLTTAQFSKFLW